MGKDQKTQDGRRRGGKSLRREFSAGGVVFKKDKSKILWLVARTAPSDLYPNQVWRLPKGWIDDSKVWGVPGPMGSGKIKADEDSLQKAALREVGEEGGIKAKIVKKIATSRFFYTHPVNGKILKFVTYYLMEYVEDLPEGFDEETSEILWLPYEKADKKLSFNGEKQMLKKASEVLADTSQPSLLD